MLLDHLPIPSLCRFRVVSKAWHATCSGGVQSREKADGRGQVLFDGGGWGRAGNVQHSTTSLASSVMGSARKEEGVPWVNVISCGGRVIKLPNRPSHQSLLFADMDVLHDSSYLVVAVEGFQPRSTVTGVHVYHSTSGRWVSRSLELREGEVFVCGWQPRMRKAAALRGSTLFFFGRDGVHGTLYSMDLLHGVSHVYTPCPLYTMRIEISRDGVPNLVVCAGRLFLVSMECVRVRRGISYRTAAIQEFKEENKEWNRVSSLPLDLIPGKAKNVGLRWGALLQVSADKGELCLCLGRVNYVYDLFADTWSMLPVNWDVYNVFPFDPTAL